MVARISFSAACTYSLRLTGGVAAERGHGEGRRFLDGGADLGKQLAGHSADGHIADKQNLHVARNRSYRHADTVCREYPCPRQTVAACGYRMCEYHARDRPYRHADTLCRE